MGMSSLILDDQEMFWEGAQDVVIECESFQEFVGMMKPQMDLVVNIPQEEIIEDLHELWNEAQGNVA